MVLMDVQRQHRFKLKLLIYSQVGEVEWAMSDFSFSTVSGPAERVEWVHLNALSQSHSTFSFFFIRILFTFDFQLKIHVEFGIEIILWFFEVVRKMQSTKLVSTYLHSFRSYSPGNVSNGGQCKRTVFAKGFAYLYLFFVKFDSFFHCFFFIGNDKILEKEKNKKYNQNVLPTVNRNEMQASHT